MDRWNRRHGFWRTREVDASVVALATRAAEDGVAAARAAQVRARVHHPVTKAPEWKCYRVIRRFTVHGELCFEDIGSCKTHGEALAISTHEAGHAVILDPNNKTLGTNGQPIEAREA